LSSNFLFLGAAGYASAYAAKAWGLTPELAILFGTACAVSVLLLLLAAVYFYKTEREFADII